eukprot:GCRY01001101.1.p1 GENE.GCRY01001101.1~~GCRY01001101.1.p1  ORF type:complete len:451 (+),score=54.91 GCRY01001101.1:110-1354(+)
MNIFDLSGVLSQSLDRHMIFPLLEFLQSNKVYCENDLLEAKLKILNLTNMVDFALDVQNLLNIDRSDELVHKREEIVSVFTDLQEQVTPLLDIFTNEELMSTLQEGDNFNFDHLSKNFQIDEECVEALYHFAKYQYECGNYSSAADLLSNFQLLNHKSSFVLSSLWGKLASEILLQNWETALLDFNKIVFEIEKNTALAATQLQQRNWLLHWGLFIFFNHSNGRNLLNDLFSKEQFLNCIQSVSPYLLRYFAASSIISKKKKAIFQTLYKVLDEEKYAYSDPITDFLLSLQVHFDFDLAHRKLNDCVEVIKNDFFLVGFLDEFLENAKLMIFETYCRIHEAVDISMLAQRLNMESPQAEKWIVNLIRNAHFDAKIDSKNNVVLMGVKNENVLQEIIETTRFIPLRSSFLKKNNS